MKKNRIIKLILIITICLIIIDQISKVVIQYRYENPIGNFIGIELVQNMGMAFGLNSGNTKNIILTSYIIVIIINFVKNQKDRIDTETAVAISMILAGGISNLLDRIIRGGVIDFIKIKYFAIFNIADCYIVLGWILLIIMFVKFNREIVLNGDKVVVNTHSNTTGRKENWYFICKKINLNMFILLTKKFCFNKVFILLDICR